MQDIVTQLQDMRHLDWAARKMSPGTPGCFLKAYEEVDGKRIIIIDGKDVETWISVSENFRKDNEEKLAYDMYYDLQKKDKESPLDFAIRMGWGLYIYQMFCIDYLIANRDRHGSNLEILRNEVDESIRMAPLFDQGVSLLFSTYGNENEIECVDVMRDFTVNNYIGARSLEYNLTLIPLDFDLKINSLKQEDKAYIFHEIYHVLSQKHIDKIWEMIWKRWCYFAEIRSKKK